MAWTVLFAGRDGIGDGGSMQAVMRNRGLVVAVLVIAMLAAVLLVTCSDGIHLASPAATVGACLTMAHSTVVGAVIGADAGRILASTMLAAIAVLAMLMVTVRTTAAPTLRSAAPGRPIDPLNGRLRL
jgi:hypothetical protein